ncbi:MAG: hypothetical protein KA204_00220 [Chromatiaceae bacterium]|nr:hypothetical protein [Chromatiaceae bacterium]
MNQAELDAASIQVYYLAKRNSTRSELAELAQELGFEHHDAWRIADEVAAAYHLEDL